MRGLPSASCLRALRSRCATPKERLCPDKARKGGGGGDKGSGGRAATPAARPQALVAAVPSSGSQQQAPVKSAAGGSDARPKKKALIDSSGSIPEMPYGAGEKVPRSEEAGRTPGEGSIPNFLVESPSNEGQLVGSSPIKPLAGTGSASRAPAKVDQTIETINTQVGVRMMQGSSGGSTPPLFRRPGKGFNSSGDLSSNLSDPSIESQLQFGSALRFKPVRVEKNSSPRSPTCRHSIASDPPPNVEVMGPPRQEAEGEVPVSVTTDELEAGAPMEGAPVAEALACERRRVFDPGGSNSTALAAVSTVRGVKAPTKVWVVIAGHPCVAVADSGATSHIISSRLLQQWVVHWIPQEHDEMIEAYGGTLVPILGEAELPVQLGNASPVDLVFFWLPIRMRR